MVRTTTAALLAFLLFLILHFLQFHYFFSPEKAAAVFKMALLGLVVFGLFYWLLPDESSLCRRLRIADTRFLRLFPLLLGIFFYGCLFLGYLEFYFTADRSITFRMLRIVGDAQAGVTSAEMLKTYDTNAIILRRFEDMEYGGYLRKEAEHYYLTGKGDRTLGLYRFVINYLHLGQF